MIDRQPNHVQQYVVVPVAAYGALAGGDRLGQVQGTRWSVDGTSVLLKYMPEDLLNWSEDYEVLDHDQALVLVKSAAWTAKE